MELRDFLQLLRRRRGLIVALAVLGGLVAYGISMAIIPVYEAQAKLLVVARTRTDGGVTSAYEGALLSQQLTKSFAEIIKSRTTVRVALNRGSYSLTPNEVQARLGAEAIPDTLLIRLTVRDTDPSRARVLAGDIAAAFITRIPSLQGNTAVRVSLVEPPLTPTIPVEPKTTMNVVLGVLLGILVGIGAVWLAEQLDTTIKSPQALEEAVGAPVIGTIPMFAAKKDSLPAERQRRSIEAEAYRKLRTNFSFLGVDQKGMCCVISSAVASEGKSTTAANLALSLAQAGLRVVLIDGDLRKPATHKLFRLPDRVGTTTVLLSKAELVDAMHRWGDEPLRILAAGELPPNPSELLGSRQMGDLIREARSQADVVLIDCAPILPVSDPMVVGQWADGLLLVTRAGSTTRDHLQAARAACDKTGVRLLGAVLNAASGPSRGRRAAYYQYYEYGPSTKETAAVGGNGSRTLGRHSRRGGRSS